ncbi:MAG: DUF2617 family protein [Pirellulaceae bacterium]|nr:DUF2617 family protein [Planctomycetales bacterium]
MLTVRPRFTELAFHLYGRPLHPELFEFLATRRIERDTYRADIAITSSGHVITFTQGPVILTEVSASPKHPLPQRRCLSRQTLTTKHQERIDYREGITYETQYYREPANPGTLIDIEHQMPACGEAEGLVHRFGPSGRMSMGAFSYIDIQTRSQSLMVKAFHTFPDDGLVLRSQTTIRLRPASKADGATH